MASNNNSPQLSGEIVQKLFKDRTLYAQIPPPPSSSYANIIQARVLLHTLGTALLAGFMLLRGPAFFINSSN